MDVVLLDQQHPARARAAADELAQHLRRGAGRWSSSKRVCTRSNAARGSSAVARSSDRDLEALGRPRAVGRRGRRPGRGRPAPTRAASQRANEPPPAPASRQRQPGATPSASAQRMLDGSWQASSSSSRRRASSQALGNVYAVIAPAPGSRRRRRRSRRSRAAPGPAPPARRRPGERVAAVERLPEQLREQRRHVGPGRRRHRPPNSSGVTAAVRHVPADASRDLGGRVGEAAAAAAPVSPAWPRRPAAGERRHGHVGDVVGVVDGGSATEPRWQCHHPVEHRPASSCPSLKFWANPAVAAGPSPRRAGCRPHDLLARPPRRPRRGRTAAPGARCRPWRPPPRCRGPRCRVGPAGRGQVGHEQTYAARTPARTPPPTSTSGPASRTADPPCASRAGPAARAPPAGRPRGRPSCRCCRGSTSSWRGTLGAPGPGDQTRDRCNCPHPQHWGWPELHPFRVLDRPCGRPSVTPRATRGANVRVAALMALLAALARRLRWRRRRPASGGGPVKIRMGWGIPAEEIKYVMMQHPEVAAAPRQARTRSSGTSSRAPRSACRALAAGTLDCATRRRAVGGQRARHAAPTSCSSASSSRSARRTSRRPGWCARTRASTRSTTCAGKTRRHQRGRRLDRLPAGLLHRASRPA